MEEEDTLTSNLKELVSEQIRNMSDFESPANLNQTSFGGSYNFSDHVVDDFQLENCGTLGFDEIQTIHSCGYWVEGVAMTILGAIALITNLISIYAFSRREMRNSFNSLIVVLTVMDSVFCVLLVADYSFARAFEMHTVFYTLLYPYFIYPFTNIMLSASIFMTFLETKIVVENNVTPIGESYQESPPRDDEYPIEDDVMMKDRPVMSYLNVTTYTIDVTDLRNNPIYIKYYMKVTRTVLLGILPFIALIFFNVKIYLRFLLTRGRYTRSNSNSSQAKDLQLAMILVCIVCMFFVTNLPRLLLNLYELFNVDLLIKCGDNFWPPVWFMCMTSVNHLLLVLNCIMNFVVYCFFNDGFKRVILKMVGQKVESRNASQGQMSQGPDHRAPLEGRTPPPPSLVSSRRLNEGHDNNHPHQYAIVVANIRNPEETSGASSSSPDQIVRQLSPAAALSQKYSIAAVVSLKEQGDQNMNNNLRVETTTF
ncbi:hypothetical protein TCAL_05466 [Tigriopus californicus]|uniref:G-protein coupled receptors family 1 profile domain-containing protein n=1 Tax=Tigriopus californicus TaxID=6832 RepID=A0A553P8J4_TIGCA|nr:hypothetical protein TCAL_05466 [Tigriopus californicus]